MQKQNLWSIRLGYSNKQANNIEKLGIKKFLHESFEANFETNLPSVLDDEPKTLIELKSLGDKLKNGSTDEKKEKLKKSAIANLELKAWWVNKMIENEFPLREKMTCFWHNHYVATFQKVKVNYWIYQHNQTLRENAFGNFKELTKKIIKTNAMVKYLDNVDNKNNNFNENLSRELLELFTLGIGNYTETDIKNGAKALAGLGIGREEAAYRKKFENNDNITYFNKSGKFKVDELIDIIFEQKAIPYLITEKILKWFIYDNPDEKLVTYYGDYFKKQNFEIKPLLIKIFTEEYNKPNEGSKIKDPLVFTLQMLNELQIQYKNTKIISVFLKQQGMDLFNQPNVKGWIGGNEWLTSQIFLQRQNTSDLLCIGGFLNKKKQNTNQIDNEEITENMNQNEKFMNSNKNKTTINFKKGTNKQIIAELSNRLLFQTDDDLQKDMEQILKYDFDAENQNAEKAVMRLFNYITKTPEFQLI